jgi:hypothetical protein
MKQDIHIAWDYRASFEVMRSTFGEALARASDSAKTQALCGAKIPVTRAKGLDELCEVTCDVCLARVAKEGKARTPGGMKRRMKPRMRANGRPV